MRVVARGVDEWSN